MLANLIEDYGYLALFVGTFLEGETILLVAAFAAHRGYLDIQTVMAVAFAGSFLGDQLWFSLARRYSGSLLDRRPRLKAKLGRAFRFLERFGTSFVLGFRFLYGLRAVASVAFGMTAISRTRFAVLNAVGAIVWAVVLGGAGYLLGEALERFLDEASAYERPVFAVLLLVVVLVVVRRRNRRISAGALPAAAEPT